MTAALARLKSWKARDFAWAVFGLALVLRLAFLVLALGRGWISLAGGDNYYSIALDWLGWGPASEELLHPPVYPAFLAALMGPLGRPETRHIMVLQCALGAAAAPLIWSIGSRLAGEAEARLAAVLVALDPMLVSFAPQIQSETVFLVLELLFFAGLYRLLERKSSGAAWLALGLTGSAAILCRGVLAAYPAILFPALVLRDGWRKTLRPFAFLAAGWLLPVLGWGLRNQARHGLFVPGSIQSGWNLYEGFTLDREEIRRRPYDMLEESRRLGLTDLAARDRYFKAKALAAMRERPFEAAKIIAGKALLYWRPWLYDPYTRAQRWALGAYFLVLLPLAAVGLYASRARALDWGPIYALLLYLTAMHAVFFTALRYRLPLEPFLCLLAVLGAVRLAGGAAEGRAA